MKDLAEVGKQHRIEAGIDFPAILAGDGGGILVVEAVATKAAQVVRRAERRLKIKRNNLIAGVVTQIGFRAKDDYPFLIQERNELLRKGVEAVKGKYGMVVRIITIERGLRISSFVWVARQIRVVNCSGTSRDHVVTLDVDSRRL